MKLWIKVKPHYVEAQLPPLSAKVSFIRIDPVDWNFILITGPKQSQTEFDPPYYQLTILKKELLSMQGIHENASSLVNNYHIAVHFVLSENWFQISTCRPVP